MVGNLYILQKLLQVSENDERIISVISYGSYARDDFDKFSDIDLYVFIGDDYFKNFDSEKWLESAFPVQFSYINSYGVTEVVFKYGTRGEFHFLPYSGAKNEIDGWKGKVFIKDAGRTLLIDKRGELEESIIEITETGIVEDRKKTIDETVKEFADGIIFEWNILQRKDLFRSYTLHFQNLRNCARLISLKYNKVEHIYSPRLLETFMDRVDFNRFRECIPRLEADSLTECLEKLLLYFIEEGKRFFTKKQEEILNSACERVIKRAYRIEIAVLKGSEVLFIEQTHKNPDKSYWLLPGGGREIGETDLQTAMRELKEETGLKVERIEYFNEYDTPPRDTYPYVKMFLAHYRGGEPSPGEEPEDPDGVFYKITAIKWFDLLKEKDIDELILKNGDYLEKKIRELSLYMNKLRRNLNDKTFDMGL